METIYAQQLIDKMDNLVVTLESIREELNDIKYTLADAYHHFTGITLESIGDLEVDDVGI